MLEHHFLTGTRYLWTVPNQMPPATIANVGAIVNSTIAANPLRYDGFRIGLHPGLEWAITAGAGNLGVLGAPLAHTWLAYSPGRTTYVNAGGDVLTGFMSGCVIARGTYAGAMRVFHVGTSDNTNHNRITKLNFSDHLPADATGFDPSAAWTHAERQTALQHAGLVAGPPRMVMALVTAAGHFFSFILFRVQENGTYTNPAGLTHYFAGGIKHVPALSRIQLRGALLP